MSSNIPPNSPPIPGGNGLNPQAMWMPYSFVQFDGSFNSNPSNNRISQPQGMSAYGGVIFQQPFQPPQLQNDPNRPNSEMMPQFPLISSPPPPANITIDPYHHRPISPSTNITTNQHPHRRRVKCEVNAHAATAV